MRAYTALGLVAFCTVAARADSELIHQSPLMAPGGWASQDARNPGGMGWFAEVADDFQVPSSGWSLNTVQFWGGYVQPANSPGHPSGFTIRFYSDAGGAPGTRLFERDIAQFNEVLFSQTGISQLAQYSYSCSLSPGFEPPSAGRYWLSVVAILDRGGFSTEPQWGWSQAVPPVNWFSAQNWFFSPSHTFQPLGVDVAFAISGSLVPSPSSAAVLAGMLLSGRRRRRLS